MKKSFFFLLLSFISFDAMSQQGKWVFSQNIPVYTEKKLLKNAWAGGFNYPQFSSLDVNDDGYQDLVAFEREGDVFRIFLYQEGKYKYTYEYQDLFPELKNWALLVDYDMDGKKDIFAFNVLGIEVWTWKKGAKTPQWEKQYFQYNTPEGIITKDALKTKGSSGWDVNINVNYQDIPSIADIDGDGKADILCFGLTTAMKEGITLEYFRQTEPLVFTKEDYCWGGFVQAYTSNDIYLDVCKKESASVRPQTKMMHLGSALLAMDISGNGLKDLIMGELSFSNATVVYNTGSTTYAHMSTSDAHFPSDDVAVNIENLPAFFAVDVDHDEQEELLVAPAVTGSENYNSILLYKNIGNGQQKQFSLIKRGYLQDQMIDVGEGSAVVFADVDRDGKTDMIVSNYGYYQKGHGGYVSKLAFFKNTGTMYSPEFTLVNDDFAWLSSLKKTGARPAFADLNTDGILDMVVGDSDGYLHLFYGKKMGHLLLLHITWEE